MVSSRTPAFIVNSTRGTALAQSGRVLTGLETGIGAMVRGLPKSKTGTGAFVLDPGRFGSIAITNLFVFVPLDIIWVDEHWCVVDLTLNFRPWSLHTVNTKPARYVIEVPAGAALRSGTRVGDALSCAAHTPPLAKATKPAKSRV